MEIFFILCLTAGFFSTAIGLPLVHLLWKKYKRPGESIPGWNTRQQSVEDLFDPKDVAIVLAEFERAWHEIIDKRDVRKVLDNVNIYWKSEPIDLGMEYKVGGKTFSKATGITKNKKDTDVWIYDYYYQTINDKKIKIQKNKKELKLYSTALVHELIHIALWNLDGNPDADHEGEVHGKTWTEKHSYLEREINNRLRDKDI